MVNYPSLPGLRGFPGHRTFYAKTGTVPRNLGSVDPPTLWPAGSQSFWKPPERLHGTQLRIISMKGKEVEYLSTDPQWLRITPRHYISVTPDLTCAGAGHAPVPSECPLKERHRKMLAYLWSVCRQTLGSAKGDMGRASTLSDTWLFLPNLMGKRMSSMLFSLGFPI